jgi:hypothetical protein
MHDGLSRIRATLRHEEAYRGGAELPCSGMSLSVEDELQAGGATDIMYGEAAGRVQLDAIGSHSLDDGFLEVGHARGREAALATQWAYPSLLLAGAGQPFLVIIIKREARIEPITQPPDAVFGKRHHVEANCNGGRGSGGAVVMSTREEDGFCLVFFEVNRVVMCPREAQGSIAVKF